QFGMAASPRVKYLCSIFSYLVLRHISSLPPRRSSDLVPLIPSAVGFAKQNVITGASARNWNSYGDQVGLSSHVQPWQQALISDPDRKSTRLNSSHVKSSYSVFCLNKKSLRLKRVRGIV